MTRALKIVQITDLHLCADTEATLHGWHVQHAWRRVHDDAMARHPDADLWLLSGDLVDDISTAGYVRLNAELALLDTPVLALAGNHDDPTRMQQLLTRAHVHTRIALGDWQVYALNSHVDASAAGRVGPSQLDALHAQLSAHAEPAVICVHHPPVTLGSAWLDAIGLHDGPALCDLVRTHPHVAAVVCGHAHQACATTIGQATCWITPATMRQFLPGATDFAVDTTAAPGYRVIRLRADGTASSHVQRIRLVDNSGDN